MAVTERETEAEIAAERRVILQDLLESRGWREVLRPLLYQKARAIERTLATDEHRDIERIRHLQGRYQTLMSLADLQAKAANGLKGEG